MMGSSALISIPNLVVPGRVLICSVLRDTTEVGYTIITEGPKRETQLSLGWEARQLLMAVNNASFQWHRGSELAKGITSDPKLGLPQLQIREQLCWRFLSGCVIGLFGSFYVFCFCLVLVLSAKH